MIKHFIRKYESIVILTLLDFSQGILSERSKSLGTFVMMRGSKHKWLSILEHGLGPQRNIKSQSQELNFRRAGKVRKLRDYCSILMRDFQKSQRLPDTESYIKAMKGMWLVTGLGVC
jgi:hypothetical protein